MPKGETSERRPYEQEDAFRSKHVVDGVLSSTGSFCVYALSETVSGRKRDEERQVSSLWHVELTGGPPRRLTARGINAARPQISPDERFVFYLGTPNSAGEPSQVYRLSLGGGESEEIIRMDQGVTSFTLSPDGGWIAFVAMKQGQSGRREGKHVRIKRLTYCFDPRPGYLHDLAEAIYLVRAEGGVHHALTPHDGLVTALAWSNDSQNLAAVLLGKEDRTTTPFIQELSVIGLNGEVRKLVELINISAVCWTVDGRQIGCSAAAKFGRQPQLHLVDRSSGTTVCRTESFGLPVGGFVQAGNPTALARSRILMTSDGSGVIASAGKGGEIGLERYGLIGPESRVPVVTGERACIALDRVGELLLFAAQDFVTPSELHVIDLKSGEERVLTDHNGELRARIAWPTVEHVIVESAPGVRVEGWAWKPPRGELPLKTVLFIHGGPHAAYGYSFNEDFHELVGAGYVVVFANPRGSTGYGDPFSTAIVGRWGDPELEDLNAFLDELVRRGIADPYNLGVTGVSGGGRLSAWLIGHSDRFKAAVPEQGDYNLLSIYGASDAAGLDRLEAEMGGPPHKLAQRYWDHSPIAYAHICKTPTLLIQGEKDTRCPMEEAEQFFTVLKYNGCEVELLKLENCNHAVEMYGPPPLRRARMNAIKEWFERHLR